jgi:hypothetical protein
MIEIEEIKKFIEVAKYADIVISENQLKIIDRGCPHSPSGLINGMMGIYIFELNGVCLKIGKAGEKSNARFRSQHYSPKRSKSTLAKSILNDPNMKNYGLNEENISDWIKNNTRRYDIFIDSELGIPVLNLLEAYLQCKFKPKYEGFESQK